MNDVVYLDNSAATWLDERVLEAMRPYFFDTYAVATSEFAYTMGIEAREALEGSRESIARALGASPGEVVFTSGATESTNMALKGVAMAGGGTTWWSRRWRTSRCCTAPGPWRVRASRCLI